MLIVKNQQSRVLTLQWTMNAKKLISYRNNIQLTGRGYFSFNILSSIFHLKENCEHDFNCYFWLGILDHFFIVIFMEMDIWMSALLGYRL